MNTKGYRNQNRKITNYHVANQTYMNALNLLKTMDLEKYMDKIPFPASSTVINVSDASKKNGGGLLSKLIPLALTALLGAGGVGAYILSNRPDINILPQPAPTKE